MLEADFQKIVVELAHRFGWKVHHSRPAMLPKGGWATHGIDPGFPDLVMAHRERGIIIAELKSEKGRISEEQLAWAIAMNSHPNIRVHFWRPSQLHEIIDKLRKGNN